MSDRFDLEQKIMSCWGIVDELKILTEAVIDKEMDRDKVCNILLGLEQLYQLKFESLFETFEKCIKNKDI